MDRIGLSADGTVQERILAMTDSWPTLGEVIYGDSTFLEDWTASLRACTVALGG